MGSLLACTTSVSEEADATHLHHVGNALGLELAPRTYERAGRGQEGGEGGQLGSRRRPRRVQAASVFEHLESLFVTLLVFQGLKKFEKKFE